MQTNHETLLCRYHYDPLDRLSVCTPAEQASTGRFYQKSRLATEIQDLVQHSIFQFDDQLLAQHQRQGGTVATTLLITDQQRSVLNALDTTLPLSRAYTPYGHRHVGNGLLSLLGFNGERPDPVTGHYHLGNGYRQFNPVLMRFNSPDSWSPFGKGGINAYAYCTGDPINRTDPTGHLVKTLLKELQGNLDPTELWNSLYAVKNDFHGTKAIRAAADLEGADPKQFLLNKAINNMVNESRNTLGELKNKISTSVGIEGVIGEISEAAVSTKKFLGVSTQLRGFPDFLNKRMRDKLSWWGGELEVRLKETKKIAADRVRLLRDIELESPSPFRIVDPLASQQPDGARDKIRKS
ncbi:RHS repeat-associated core domain-containing protein [Pseudomonas sp. WJP1]|uniref:RHS repeat-associated core domain-containing protein n=1 Tax=Pseudomonas sp. WJP1 TaxID=2986947 RepID=UPI00234A7E58|nr:RHS repeat-associated core domain-containing protein [Pseudomonas sp. WJP1]WCM48649.1 RHS repeat-associated core domain-containing protein [Pseudomonas sp. WJP1]